MHQCSLDARSPPSCETKPSLDAVKLDGKIAPVENHSFKAYGHCIRILQRNRVNSICMYISIYLSISVSIYLSTYLYL